MLELKLHIESWVNYCQGISPLWQTAAGEIPIVNNPFRIIHYDVNELLTRSCFFPLRLTANDETVAWSAVQTISDNHARVRGIYVLPQYRGQGFGYNILDLTHQLFPNGFHRVFGYYRENRVKQFQDNAGLRIVPNTDWFWSEVSQIRMRLMYWENPHYDGSDTEGFIQHHHPSQGLTGTNNLNLDIPLEEWSRYAMPHYLVYPEANIELNFPPQVD